MGFSNKTIIVLAVILLLAALFRFYGLTRADVITDENLVSFRSIGYIDYLASPFQTTPYEWFDPEIPAWARLSFHDHPPLFFIIHFLFFKILGVSILVMRLPEVLAGIASVYLIYLIGRKLFSDKVGLVASAMMAVTAYPVWISRIALQESLTIFFSLLIIYFFIRALKNDKFFLLVGLALSLGLLTKYTVFAAALACLLYLIIYRRQFFLKRNFYLGSLIALLLFSPVIIYNLKLYQAVGHFDLQFSYLLGQPAPEWQNLMGKPTGNYWQRLIQFFTNLRAGLTPTLFYSSLLAGLLFLYLWFKKKFLSNYTLVLLLLVAYCLLLIVIGPAPRFLTLLIPWLLLLLAIILVAIFEFAKGVIRYSLIGILVLLFGYEIFFSYNTSLAYYPLMAPGIDYARPLRMNSYSWGFNQLDYYLDQLLADKTPELTIPAKYQFLENLKSRALARDERQGKEKLAALIIYEANIYDLATMWLFHRRAVYQGWPIVTADLYLKKGKDYFTEAGVQEFYFIKATDYVLLKEPAERTNGATVLVERLKEEGREPEAIIVNPRGEIGFEIYKF